MRRGFKAHAERLALEVRESMGLRDIDPLNPKEFLESQGIVVWTPEEISALSSDDLKQLTEIDPTAWSGVSIRLGEVAAIIINSAHDSNRNASTMMHEWAHIKLGHKPNRMDTSDDGILLLSDYPKDIEEEADFLAAACLLPRGGLLHFCRNEFEKQAIADHYKVSKQLVTMRINLTGIMRQLQASRRYGAKRN